MESQEHEIIVLTEGTKQNKTKSQKGTSTNLIEEIATYIESRLETNPDFLINLACVLVAVAAGPYYYVMTEKGRLNLNLSSLYIGGSGISNKSLSLRIVQKILEMLSGYLGKNIILPSVFSIEGMTLRLHTMFVNDGIIPEGVILSDEYTKMIKGTKSKDWMANTLEYMAQLYSGVVETSMTVKHGLQNVPEVYVNFAGATTYYLISLISEGFFIQGNGVRIIFVIDDERKYHVPDVDSLKRFWDYDQQQQETELEIFAQKLFLIRERALGAPDAKNGIKIELSDYAQRILYNYKEVVSKRAHNIYGENLFDPRANYLSRLFEFALKKAALHSIARHYDTKGDIIVNQIDTLFGITEAQKAYKAFLRLQELEREYKGKKVEHPSSTRVNRDMVLLCLKSRKMCSVKELINLTGLKERTVQRSLQELRDEGKVEKIGKTKGAKWKLK